MGISEYERKTGKLSLARTALTFPQSIRFLQITLHFLKY